MRRIRVIAAALAAGSIGAAACSGNGTGPNGNGGSPATLSADVQPILTQRCALSGCHVDGTSAQPNGKPMDLSTATQTFQNTVNVSALQVPSLNRVTPNDANNSYLVAKIEGRAGQLGGTNTQMPLQNCCLSQTQINTIRAWISAGAQNN